MLTTVRQKTSVREANEWGLWGSEECMSFLSEAGRSYSTVVDECCVKMDIF